MADPERVGPQATTEQRDYRQHSPIKATEAGDARVLRCGQEDQAATSVLALVDTVGREPRARGSSGEYPGPRWLRASCCAPHAARFRCIEKVFADSELGRPEARHGHRDRRRDGAQKPRSGTYWLIQSRRWVVERFVRLDQPQPATGKGPAMATIASARAIPSTPPPSCSSSAALARARGTFETDS